MTRFSAKRLLVATEASLEDARRQLRECERAWRNSDFQHYPEEELLSGQQAQLAYFLRKVHLNVVMLLEAAEAPRLLDEYLRDFEPFRSDLGKTEHYDEDPEVMFSEALIYLTHFTETVGPQILAEDAERLAGRRQLIRILREIPYYLRGIGVSPQSEKQVCDPAHALLKAVYPDTTREFSIPQPHKTYHVDMGIKSLRTGIEFKFVATEQELKTALDGILVDMKGYHGSKDWDQFLAVFYTAGPVESQSRIEAAFRVMEGGFNWRPIVVVGDGGRKPKRKPASTKPPRRTGRGAAPSARRSHT